MNDHFLNLHVLVTSSVANANRDDTGAPKQVTYGGVTRHRLSSQAMTRAKRIGYELDAGGDQVTWRSKSQMTELAMCSALDLSRQNGAPLTDAEQISLRKLLAVEITSLVVNREKALAATATRAKAKAATAKAKVKAGPAPTDDRADDDSDDGGSANEGSADGDSAATADDAAETGKKDTLVWLAEHEINSLVQRSLTALRTGASAGDFVNVGGRTQSLSIAAFGRMFAFRPDLQNEAAVQRSHAFTTHAADIEPDYFTAVDDLETGSGAGHLDMAQYGGGVFYWHCNVDRRQLWDTWDAGSDDELTRSRLTGFFEQLLCAQPSGKQATTAHKTMPDAVLVVPAGSPVALHQAFEAPIPSDAGGGFRVPSVEALLAQHERIRAFTPRQFPAGAHYAGTLEAPTSRNQPTITTQASLDDVVDVCVEWVLAGRPGR